MNEYKHILVPVDLTPHSEDTAAKACELANFYGAKLSLIHVVEPMPVSWITHADKDDVQDLMHRVFGGEVHPCNEELGIAKQLQDFGAKYKVPKADQHFCMGQPKKEILKLAEQIAVDLIVVGSHGHHGLGNLIGSTAQNVVASAPCDVLMVSFHRELAEEKSKDDAAKVAHA